MTGLGPNGFRFGIEAEHLLVDAKTFRALWHPDLKFAELNEALEAIDVADLPPLDGLELEPPHRNLMPYAVEGYHIPAPDLSPVDILPKGIEIRTPICSSIEECLECYAILHARLEEALLPYGYRLACLSHHPVEDHFEGPVNKRRYDYWQWAMEVMVTYGPDINVSLPPEMRSATEPKDLSAKVNYYGPALAALTVASPFLRGDLWRIRGRVGKSIRTYRRSVIAPAIELHPQEGGRMEFKLFEATPSLEDYGFYLLLWLDLLLDNGLKGRASNQSRMYDLGQVARYGLDAETVADRAGEVLDRAPKVLTSYGFNPEPLRRAQQRLVSRRAPADDLIALYESEGSMEGVLRNLCWLMPLPQKQAL